MNTMENHWQWQQPAKAQTSAPQIANKLLVSLAAQCMSSSTSWEDMYSQLQGS